MGEGDKQPDEEKCVELAAALMDSGTMLRLILHLSALPFEARKETSFVSTFCFCSLRLLVLSCVVCILVRRRSSTT